MRLVLVRVGWHVALGVIVGVGVSLWASRFLAGLLYGLEPRVVPLIGGTTPMYLFARKGVPVVAPGVGYHANRAHGPDEHVRIADFRRAAKHLARLVVRFAQ